MGWGCCWSWLVRPGDTHDEARIKTLMFPVCFFFFMFALASIFSNLQDQRQMVHIVGSCINAFAHAFFMLGVVANAVPAGYLLDTCMVLVTFAICLIDLSQATRSYSIRAWAYVVLVLDCVLIFKRHHMPRVVIPIVLLYSVAVQVESVARFGLYEVGYWGSAGVEISY
eukprot:Hpha_TRINITY_DN16395_c1_g5::TRINITY_DN16395_c1_g5_i1::g.60504::m.60504